MSCRLDVEDRSLRASGGSPASSSTSRSPGLADAKLDRQRAVHEARKRCTRLFAERTKALAARYASYWRSEAEHGGPAAAA